MVWIEIFIYLYMHEPYVKNSNLEGSRFWAPMCPGYLLVSSPALAQHGGNKKLSNIFKNADVKHGNKMSRAVFSA